MSKDKQIIKLRQQGFSQRRIADSLKVSRNTISKVLVAFEKHEHLDQMLDTLNDEEFHRQLFPEEQLLPSLVIPDFDYIHKELLKVGVTLRLLWDDYVDECRRSNKPPYMYSQFCKLYQDHVNKNRLTMHIKHKPGDKIMVDWTGTTLPLHDELTGRVIKVYLFVGTLPFSMYCYAQACLTMKEDEWINAHVKMWEFFQGTSRLLIPDNLKTGITSHKKYEDPITNKSYQELGDYYGTAILPARVLKPQDKAAVESSVGSLTTHIIARLRNRKFFHVNELNKAIWKELDRYNKNEFQKRDGSRFSVYIEEELPFLQPLPRVGYEYANWKTAMVQLNYHIALNYQYYSVPCEYVKKQVDVRYTHTMVEIYYKSQLLTSHKRLHGRRGQYSTIIDHMPANHQLYSEWDSKRFLRWAQDIGPSTRLVVKKHFESYRVEEQAYKGCLALLKLADKYTEVRLETACEIALKTIPYPRYTNIRLILESNVDRKTPASNEGETKIKNEYAIVRGASYYGGNTDEK